jgi:mono/diheme cytochrome c family protein
MIEKNIPPSEAFPMKRPIAALAAFSFAVLSANAAAAADAYQGGVLAKRWCAACHVVAADQARGNTQAPPFSEIAKKPGLTPASIALFLLRPHPPMPDMNLTRNEAGDLAAYIASQK